jgi:hypothetical protein
VAALFRYGVELAALKGVTGVVQGLPQEALGAGLPVSLVATVPRPVAVRAAGSTKLLQAIVEAVLPHPLVGLPASDEAVVAADVTAFAAGQVQALPRRLRLAFAAGLAVFALSVRVRHPRGFAAQPRATRVALVDGWAFGEWPTGRKLFRLIRSIALLAVYEHPLVVGQLEIGEDRRLHTIDRGER